MVSLGRRNQSKPKVEEYLFRSRDTDMNLNTIGFFYGRQGGGKSITLLSTALSYFGKMKIIDFFGGIRQEYLYYPMKSHREKYWNRVQQKFFFKEDLRKEYPTHYLVPMWKGNDYKKIMKKLPKSDNCRFTFFTLDITQIEPNWLSGGYGNVSKMNSSIWTNAQRKLSSSGTNHEFYYHLTQIGENYNFTAFLKRFTDNYLFQGRNCPYNLDIESEIDNKKEISVLYTDHLPTDEVKFLVITIFLRLAQKYIVSRSRKNTILLAREVSTFFSKDSSLGGSGGYVDGFKNQIAEISKMSRSGCHFLLDTQNASSVKHLLQGSEAYNIFTKTPLKELEYALGEESSKVSIQLKRAMENLKAGFYLFVPQHSEADLRYNFLPRCSYWEEGSGNAWEDGGAWDKYDGNRLATQPFMNEIMDWADKDKSKIVKMTKERRVKKKWKSDDEVDFDDVDTDEEDEKNMINDGSISNDSEEEKIQKEIQRDDDFVETQSNIKEIDDYEETELKEDEY